MKVVFAVPSYTKAPCIEFTMAALSTQSLLLSSGINMVMLRPPDADLKPEDMRLEGSYTTAWRFRGGDPYVHKCRNVLASEFLRDHQDADSLFFLDDDVGWQPEAVLRALKRPEDIIAGIYPKKQDDILDEPVYRKDGTEIPAGSLFWKVPNEWPVELIFREDGTPIERDGLYAGALVATGFLRIKRHVLVACQQQSIEYPEQDRKFGVLKCWDLFRTGAIANEPNGMTGRWWGEDFFFSVMARNLGFEIWVDPDILFTHSGQKTWMGCFKPVLEKKIAEMTKLKKAA
jgi:hypothetical protein